MEKSREEQGRRQDRSTLGMAAHPQSQHVGDRGRGARVQEQWCSQILTENRQWGRREEPARQKAGVGVGKGF